MIRVIVIYAALTASEKKHVLIKNELQLLL
jgi:hypothetical protein